MLQFQKQVFMSLIYHHTELCCTHPFCAQNVFYFPFYKDSGYTEFMSQILLQ